MNADRRAAAQHFLSTFANGCTMAHGFQGWFSSSPVDETTHTLMCNALGAEAAATAGARAIVTTVQPLGRCADAEGRIAVIVGHPRWREDGLDALARRNGPAHALLAAWRRYGDALPEHLLGDFAFVVVDAPAGRVYAATDRIGRQPLYYAVCGRGLAFATSASALRVLPGVDATIQPQAIYAYLYFHMVPSPLTIHAGIHKLPGAHCLDWRGDTPQPRCWWTPTFDESADADAASLGAQLRTLIRASVGELAADARCGAFLSGGLDSSTVAGVLAEVKPSDADTFSIGFAVPGYDETGYARIAVARFGTRQHEHYVSADDVLVAVPHIAAHYDEPFGNSSAIPAYYCARLAREAGIERLLAGDGGDELFAGNERYAKQKTFELWWRVPGGLRDALTRGLHALPAAGPLAKARSYIAQAGVPLPDRLETYNFLHRIAGDCMFTPAFLAAVDEAWPERWLREVWQRPEHASTLNRMMYLDWQRTLADNDLRKVERTCALAGIDVAYPLLADELVEFSCRVPSRLKLPGRRLRDFYKQAMRGFLPEEILCKPKHGFGLPFGIWMREHTGLRELAYDSLLALKQRGWLQPAFVDEAIALHRDGHAAYYGELVWVLMMLELWLAQHTGAGH